MQTLSIAEAQKLALLSQGLATKAGKGSAYSQTLSVFERLGYVQVDTISVVQRAHHHTLWSRNSGYKPEYLDKLVANGDVFEYWSHAASYLPMRDFRYSLPRKHALKTGTQNHWFKRNPKLMANVLKKIEHEGPLMAKDFESDVVKKTGWESKPTKQALETLYMQGDLMVPERRNFHKVYDLTERVLPDHVDASLPTNEEYARFLVLSFLRAHGLGALSEMTYLLKGVKNDVARSLYELLEMGDIRQVKVAKSHYFVTASSLELLNGRLSRKRAQILSPFDNLLIQRKRTNNLFNFEYLLECYVPAPKRKFGYFCLPILWDGKLVARADCKVNRKASILEVVHLHIEKSLKKREAFLESLNAELCSFASFNQCGGFTIARVSTN
ncbi:winged helix-turn-helix domain-containing protein [Vibrio sp. HN007]|uniref:winged helix-turn-helix domain-containing protein n=1 Tax=Vibrio iocasae TaxID=3098914 RepID=UPI0035D3FE7B